jgi:nitrogen-specific signal transduction histidine kinase
MASWLFLGVGLFTAALTGAVAVLSARQRPAPGAGWLALAMSGAAGWALLEGIQHHTAFHGSLVFSVLVRVVWIPIGVLGVGWLAFALTYTGRERTVTRRRLAVLSVVPAGTVVVALCHPTLLDALEGLLGPLGPVVTPLHWVGTLWDVVEVLGIGYLYLLVLVGAAFLLEVAIERGFPHPSQILLGTMVVVPLSLSLLQNLVIRSSEFNPTVVGFGISGLAGLFAVGQFRAFDLPLARARIVEELETGVLVYGPAGQVRDYNDRALAVLEPEGEPTGRDVRAVLEASPLALELPERFGVATDRPGEAPRPAGRAPAAVGDGGTVSLGRYLDGRTVAVAGDGPAHVELQVSALEKRREGSGRVVLLYDVSGRERRTRELERKNEFLDEFASVVSHDVATPLGVIENRARLIEVTGDPEHASDIYEATERVQSLVDELRELASEGVRVGDTTTVDVETVAREAWAAVETGEATLTVESSRTLEADRGRLAELFENLFDNAVEHASDTTPVAVTVGTDDAGVFVADDGPGIPAENRERVFEQGHTTTEDGSGLGLAIVRRIAEGHGWTVTVTESESGGARFEVDTGE